VFGPLQQRPALSDHGQKRVGQPMRPRNPSIDLAQLVQIGLAAASLPKPTVMKIPQANVWAILL
jgi:hypothetical protein